MEREVRIPSGEATLRGTLAVPEGAGGIVLFAHGSGSSRSSPRNVLVARALQDAGLATLLFDLLTEAEEDADRYTQEHRFDITLLTRRLVHATQWLDSEPAVRDLPIGYFGASTGSAAALAAAATVGNEVSAVVSRGGRPDLAGAPLLARVTAPTLLIVGGDDDVVIGLNQRAHAELRCEKALVIVPGASHLFEEPGAIEQVAGLAADWFCRQLDRAGSATGSAEQ